MTPEAIREILKDAESCARLSQWEEEFCDDMRTRLLTYGDKITVSDKQEAVLLRIETKLYG
jgi:hypothetical protein